jgi:hypothetical protein
MPNPDEHIPYKVLSQRETEELVPPNQWRQVWEVSFEGPAGQRATVMVPSSEYNLHTVDDAIQQKLLSMEQVRALGAEPPPPE